MPDGFGEGASVAPARLILTATEPFQGAAFLDECQR